MRIPVWAYPAAFAASFGAAKLATRAPAPETPTPASTAGSSSTLGQDTADPYGLGGYAGGGGYGGGQFDQFPGVPPDNYGGIDPAPSPSPSPSPAPSPTPSPSPTPAPTTSSSLITVPRPGARPAGAGGWAYFRADQLAYHLASTPWSGRYPVRVRTPVPLGAGHQGARWVSVSFTAVLPSGSQVLVRRVTAVGANGWIDVWVPAGGYSVYGASVASAQVVR